MVSQFSRMLAIVVNKHVLLLQGQSPSILLAEAAKCTKLTCVITAGHLTPPYPSAE